MFLSAYQNIYIGSGASLNIITEKETIIEASNIYLGKQAKIKKDDGGEVEPLVLGEQLRLILIEILDAIGGIKVTGVQPVISGPVHPPTMKDVESIKAKLNNIKSTPFASEYHFIEDNKNKKDK